MINRANFYGTQDNWMSVGYYVGIIFKQMLEFEVPSVEYIYEESQMQEIRAEKGADLIV